MESTPESSRCTIACFNARMIICGVKLFWTFSVHWLKVPTDLLKQPNRRGPLVERQAHAGRMIESDHCQTV